MFRITVIFISLVLLAMPSAQARLERCAGLLVADLPGRGVEPPRTGVRVTYLGTNAYLLEARGTTLLGDPYFSRMSLWRVALNLRGAPQPDLIAQHLAGRRIDGILSTHGHFDHLLDARRPPPWRVGDWVCGEPPEIRGPGDLAILGVALPDSRARFPGMLTALRPRYVLPSHQDNFFRPLERGFVFGPLIDFPGVYRAYSAQRRGTRLILLDYEKRWTLR